MAIGRRDWLFAGSRVGGERAAAIYTVIQTCKANGVEPQAYIADVGKENPDLAKEFQMEFQATAPFMQGLKGKELMDYSFNIFDSWNGRYNGAKVGSHLQDNPDDFNGALARSRMPAKDMLTLHSMGGQREANAKLAEAKAIESVSTVASASIRT